MTKKKYWNTYGYEIVEQISDNERIIKMKKPMTKEEVFSHQFFDGKEWSCCPHCGDKIGIPPTTRTVKKIIHIHKFCSAYRSSLKNTKDI